MAYGFDCHGWRAACVHVVSVQVRYDNGRFGFLGFRRRFPGLHGGAFHFVPACAHGGHQMTGADYLVTAWLVGLLLGFIRSLVQRR